MVLLLQFSKNFPFSIFLLFYLKIVVTIKTPRVEKVFLKCDCLKNQNLISVNFHKFKEVNLLKMVIFPHSFQQ